MERHPGKEACSADLNAGFLKVGQAVHLSGKRDSNESQAAPRQFNTASGPETRTGSSWDTSPVMRIPEPPDNVLLGLFQLEETKHRVALNSVLVSGPM